METRKRVTEVYCDPNYKTKKALKEAIKAGEFVTAFQPGGIFPGKTDGEATIEGPHYPEPHRWYARVLIEDERIVKVVG